MKIIEVKQHDGNLMQLTWILNNICTNSCSYCIPTSYNGKNHNYDWNNVKHFLKDLFQKYNNIHCSISGGEPSVSPFLPELVQMFYEEGHTVSLTTNGAKPAAYWTKLAPYLSNISFSYHPEFVDDGFVGKVSEAGKITPVSVRLMMHPMYWNQCVAEYQKLLDIKHIAVDTVKIYDRAGQIDSALYGYSKEQLAWISTNPGKPLPFNQFPNLRRRIFKRQYILDNGTVDNNPQAMKYINANMNNFRGYTCYIGIKSLYVHWDGSIKRGNCNVGGTIGNINDPVNINWPVSPVVCSVSECQCGTDVNIDKHV